MLAYLRARATEKCTAIGAAIIIGLGVGILADIFPTAENTALHYGAQLATGAVGVILIAARDRSLAWFRDLVLFSRKPADADQPLLLLEKPLMTDFQTLVVSAVEAELAKLSPAAQKAFADVKVAAASPTLLNVLQAGWDVAQVIHDLETRLAAQQAPVQS